MKSQEPDITSKINMFSSRDRNGVGRGRRDNNRKRSHSPRREHQNNTRNHHHHHHNTNRSHKRRSVDREKSNSRQIRRKTVIDYT